MGLRTNSPRRLLALAAPAALCILVVILSLAAAGKVARDDGEELAGGSGGDAPAAAAEVPSEVDGEGGKKSALEDLAGQFAMDDETVREVLDSEARPSSLDAFLSDLSGTDAPVGAVGWSDAEGLEHAGGEVLGAYGRAGASLQMHGFLDLHGTAWAAVLQGDGWVDVVSVTGSHEGPAFVRVARIKAG